MARNLEIRAIFRAIDKMSKPLGRMQRRIHKVTNKIHLRLRGLNKMASKLARGFGKVGRFAGKVALGGVAALGLGVGYLIKQFSKIENARAAFTPLLGGADKAQKLVDKLNETAASTPFQFETLAGSAQQLLPVMNGDIENTIKTIRMLGDTAGGNAKKLESITRGFTKASLKGKVDMESLNMIAEAGVPIFTELAKSMGKEPGKKFFKAISAGKVKVADLTKAFEGMTGEGGIFFKGMEIASQTTSGIFSTLKDNFELTAASLGEVLAPTIKDIMNKMIEVAKGARDWIANNKELIKSKVAEFIEKAKTAIVALIDGVKKLANNKSVVDGFRLALEGVGGALKWLYDNGKTIAIVVGIMGGLILIVKALTAAMWLFNIAVAANPITLIVIAIVALIAILVALGIKFGVFKAIWGVIKEIPGVIKTAWGALVDFFTGLWDKITGIVKKGADKVVGFVKPVTDFLGMTDAGEVSDSEATGISSRRSRPQVVTSEQKTARMISETHKTNTAEVTIRDATGRAAVTKGKLGAGLTLDRTGSY